FDLVGGDFPFSPGKEVAVERKGAGIFIFQHFRCLLFIPLILGREYRRTEHIKEPVHFRFNFVPKLSDRMMQSRSKLDRDTLLGRSDQRTRYLLRSRKCIGSDASGS